VRSCALVFGNGASDCALLHEHHDPAESEAGTDGYGCMEIKKKSKFAKTKNMETYIHSRFDFYISKFEPIFGFYLSESEFVFKINMDMDGHMVIIRIQLNKRHV